MENNSKITKHLEDHKVYIESLRMYMVPYSVAEKALLQATQTDTDQAANKLETAMTELRAALGNVNLGK